MRVDESTCMCACVNTSRSLLNVRIYGVEGVCTVLGEKWERRIEEISSKASLMLHSYMTLICSPERLPWRFLVDCERSWALRLWPERKWGRNEWEIMRREREIGGTEGGGESGSEWEWVCVEMVSNLDANDHELSIFDLKERNSEREIMRRVWESEEREGNNEEREGNNVERVGNNEESEREWEWVSERVSECVCEKWRAILMRTIKSSSSLTWKSKRVRVNDREGEGEKGR